MITYKINQEVDINRLMELFNQVGWQEKTKDKTRLIKMLRNSQVVVTAWDYDKIIGFARCTTDFTFNGQINNVVVDPEYRRQGIARNMLNSILQTSQEVSYVLRTEDHNVEFYTKLGFIREEYAFTYKRKS